MESRNIMYMSRQNKFLISKEASWLTSFSTNDFTKNKVLFFTVCYCSFFFYLLLPLFFAPFLFCSPPFHRHYVKQNINQVTRRQGRHVAREILKKKLPRLSKRKERQRLANIVHSNGAATCNSKAVNECIKSCSSYQKRSYVNTACGTYYKCCLYCVPFE